MSRILVIDDEQSIRSTLREILEYEKFSVNDAPDGAEGLKLAREHRYDAILCDIKTRLLERRMSYVLSIHIN